MPNGSMSQPTLSHTLRLGSPLFAADCNELGARMIRERAIVLQQLVVISLLLIGAVARKPPVDLAQGGHQRNP